MFQKLKSHSSLILLGAWLYSATAWGQSAPPAFRDLSGPGGNKLREMYSNTNANSAKSILPKYTGSAQPSMSSAGRIGLGLNTSSRSSKPFSSYSSQPTVSPYLNLFRDDFSGNKNFNYSTLVQPMLQQQQLNQQLERQNLQTNRRLQSIAAQADFNPQGTKDAYPTGHQTVFSYLGHYYPQPQNRQKRR